MRSCLKFQSMFMTSIIVSSIMVLTISGCVVSGTMDLTTTLAAIQGTQTALALTHLEQPICPTPVISFPTDSSLPQPSPTNLPPPPPTETSLAPPITATQNPPPNAGSISGALSYPSEAIPPLQVVAFHLESASFSSIETTANQGTYRIDGLTPGIYHLVAYPIGELYGGGYSQAVLCGLHTGCTDHSPVRIVVYPNEETTGIHPGDWHAPEGSFPPNPLTIEPTVPSKPTSTSESSPTSTPDSSSGKLPGSISGYLSYPSEEIPILRIVAFDIHSNAYYYVDTVPNQINYTLVNILPGTYHVVAYVQGESDITGGFTNAVLCGLEADCTDHRLVDIIVISGEETKVINPDDWYAPDGSFPPNPAQ